MANITIIGTGAYGTALANVLTDNAHNVLMYGIDEEEVRDINDNHLNSKFFSDLLINDSIRATTDLNFALTDAEYIVLGVPTFALEGVIKSINQTLKHKVVFINVAKGLNPVNNDLLSTAYEEWIDPDICSGIGSLYGPSIASEVIERKPTCIMGASKNKKVANKICELFHNDYFVMKSTTDIIGCEIGAALKNIIAVASGMFITMNSSDNASASLITMGLNEICLFALQKGAKIETFLNFACLGDLILTATSPKSRNYSLGAAIAEADNARKILSRHNKTVEGVLTCKTIYNEARNMNLELPLVNCLYEILYNNVKPSVMFDKLFTRCRLASD